MMDKLTVTVFMSIVVAGVYGLSMLSTPRRGMTKLLEKVGTGALLCFICSMLLAPIGISIAHNPFSALCAGYLGLPGIALSTFLSLWP